MPLPPRSKRFRKSKSRSRGSSTKRVPLPSKAKEKVVEKPEHQSKKLESPRKTKKKSVTEQSPSGSSSDPTVKNTSESKSSAGSSKPSPEQQSQSLPCKINSKTEHQFKKLESPKTTEKKSVVEPQNTMNTQESKPSAGSSKSSHEKKNKSSPSQAQSEPGHQSKKVQSPRKVEKKSVIKQSASGSSSEPTVMNTPENKPSVESPKSSPQKQSQSSPSKTDSEPFKEIKSRVDDLEKFYALMDAKEKEFMPPKDELSSETLEPEMTPEEKQALRKLRKEQKKLEKIKGKPKENPPAQDSNAASSDQQKKTKSELKAERRMKQEAQRAAKEAAKKQPQNSGQGSAKGTPEAPKNSDKAMPEAPKEPQRKSPDSSNGANKSVEETVPAPTKAASEQGPKERPVVVDVDLPTECFIEEIECDSVPIHYEYASRTNPAPAPVDRNGKPIPTKLPEIPCNRVHLTVKSLARAMEQGHLEDSLTQIIALLACLKNIVQDFEASSPRDYLRELFRSFKLNVDYISSRRRLLAPVKKFYRCFRENVLDLDISEGDEHAKEMVMMFIKKQENSLIKSPYDFIERTVPTLRHDQTILTFGYSGLLLELSQRCAKNKIFLNFIVAESTGSEPPTRMLKKLREQGHKAKSILLHNIDNLLGIDKVIIEPNFMYLNGWACGPRGLARLALLAKERQETMGLCLQCFKISEVEIVYPSEHELQAKTKLPRTLNRVKKDKGFSRWDNKYDVIPPCYLDELLTDRAALRPDMCAFMLYRSTDPDDKGKVVSLWGDFIKGAQNK